MTDAAGVAVVEPPDEAIGRPARPSPPPIEIKIDDEGTAHVTVMGANHEAAKVNMVQCFGAQSWPFTEGVLIQIASVCLTSEGGVNEKKINFMVSMVADMEPENHLEAMLAVQMAAVHMATMDFASRLTCTKSREAMVIYEQTMNKFARTFTTQVETLRRYRTGGQQNVRVEHVTVNEGGQAIVGNVEGGRGGRKRRSTTP